MVTWVLLLSLAGAPEASSCPRASAHSKAIRAADWAGLAQSWLAAFARAHPREKPPELAKDPALLRRQACLPRAPDGTVLTDPNQVERLHAAGRCAGDGPWLLALGPGEALTLVARDPKRGDLVIWPETIQLPGGTARVRVDGPKVRVEAAGCRAVLRELPH